MTTQKQTEIDRILAPARAIADKAAKENREFTPEENQQVKAALDQAKALKAGTRKTDLEVFQNHPLVAGTGGKAGGLGTPGTWGKAVTDHLARTGTKALTPSGTVVAPTAWAPDVITEGERAVWLTDVIPSAPPIEGEEFTYWQQTTRTNNAAPVAKGGVKPTSIFTATRVKDTVKTVAHLSEAVPRQDVQDSESLTQFVEGELRLGFMLTTDNQILQGDGIDPNFQGLSTLTGIQTHAVGTDSLSVAARKAKTKAELSLEPPTHYVLHPNDWEKFDLLQDNEQRYFFGGPGEAGPPRLWGVPVVVTEATPAGTGYVGAFSTMALLYEREGVRVDWSENVSDDFTKNHVRFRGEGRVNVAWLRPFAFVKITGIA